MFQFLMVQLKESVLSQNFWVQMFQFLMVQLKEIKNQTINRYVKFQFLMVQLKVFFAWLLRKPPPCVSIPYGTIKSSLCILFLSRL